MSSSKIWKISFKSWAVPEKIQQGWGGGGGGRGGGGRGGGVGGEVVEDMEFPGLSK